MGITNTYDEQWALMLERENGARIEKLEGETRTTYDLVRKSWGWDVNFDTARPASAYRVHQYEGRVLADRERNGSYDSDFYAVVWDGQQLKSVQFATTRCAGGGTCRVDFDDAHLPAVREWMIPLVAARAIAAEQHRLDKIQLGDELRVVRGRKVPVGTVGLVRWVGKAAEFGWKKYHGGETRVRVRIETAQGESHFVDAKNCEPTTRRAADADAISARVAEQFSTATAGQIVSVWLGLTVTPGWAVL